MSQSPQTILGVGTNATPADIKKAYRKASLKTHPDVKGGSKEAFNEVNEAYNKLINQSNSSRTNPQRRTTYRDGTYSADKETTHFGSRREQKFHTPNPYRHRTASAIKGSQQTMGTFHFDERVSTQLRTKRLRSEVMKQSQRKHTRLNMWVCTVPLIAAYGLYEYNLQQRRDMLRQNYSKRMVKKSSS
jgi:curved DNA-binding protein CbpA